MTDSLRRIALVLGALALAPVAAPAQPPHRAGESLADRFAADRADILAMAGNFKVRFDMQESTAWRPDYAPLDRKISGGFESVRVIVDTGRHIELQHLLVVDIDGKSHVIKHWRQDWDYEPARVLAYAGPDSWKWQAVPEAERKGRWSQTVWQVDDSPRYAGWGEWTSVAGMRRWTSNPSWRPLARRDAIRHPVYDRYYSVNRHQLTPTGWIHWQDNIKMGRFDGRLEPVVQEYVLNSYTRTESYDVKAADDYWAATRGFWAAVRAEWDRVAEAKRGIHVAEVADTGAATSETLLTLADDLEAGKLSEAVAIAQARAAIEAATS